MTEHTIETADGTLRIPDCWERYGTEELTRDGDTLQLCHPETEYAIYIEAERSVSLCRIVYRPGVFAPDNEMTEYPNPVSDMDTLQSTVDEFAREYGQL